MIISWSHIFINAVRFETSHNRSGKSIFCVFLCFIVSVNPFYLFLARCFPRCPASNSSSQQASVRFRPTEDKSVDGIICFSVNASAMFLYILYLSRYYCWNVVRLLEDVSRRRPRLWQRKVTEVDVRNEKKKRQNNQCTHWVPVRAVKVRMDSKKGPQSLEYKCIIGLDAGFKDGGQLNQQTTTKTHIVALTLLVLHMSTTEILMCSTS